MEKEYFKVTMIDYKEDKSITFTTQGVLGICNIDGKITRCIKNEYGVPIIIEAPSVIVKTKEGKLF